MHEKGRISVSLEKSNKGINLASLTASQGGALVLAGRISSRGWEGTTWEQRVRIHSASNWIGWVRCVHLETSKWYPFPMNPTFQVLDQIMVWPRCGLVRVVDCRSWQNDVADMACINQGRR